MASEGDIYMRSRRKEQLVTWGLPIVLTLILITVAYMQYRWSNAMAAATAAEMRTNLRTAMGNFRQELAEQFGVLCVQLQSASKGSEIDAPGLINRFDEWRRSSSFPDLVSNIYVWQPYTNSSGLSKLEVSESKLIDSAWPSELQDVHRMFLSTDLATRLFASVSGTSPESQHLRQASLKIGAIDEKNGILIVPASEATQKALLLIQIDLGVLEHRIFPQLATRYFGNPATSEYALAIVSNRGGKANALYEDPSLPDEDDQPDAQLNLFGPPMSGLDFGPALGDFTPPPSPERQSNKEEIRRRLGTGPVRLDPVSAGDTSPDWRIWVKRRNGSLEMAANSLKRRNLALSFCVLLVLAGSVALIVFNSYRSRRLARREMDFVAGVSHELRTPVSAILSISDNLASGVVTDPRRFAHYGDLIRTQARQLHHLMEQVLRFSANENHSMKPAIQSVNVVEIINTALGEIADVINASGVRVVCALAPDTPRVYSDPTMLSQCLQNLITNAVKYGGDEKVVHIKVQAVSDGQLRRQIAISVADHGIGINSEERKRIFEPFYRSPQVAQSAVHGTGLGLAITKTYVEAMKGDINVISEPGKGSTFTVHLPAAPASDAEEFTDQAALA